MGRPQEFDFDATIDAALAVFWDRGLHRTSIDDLLSASGLARSSLYNAFGGKQMLFEYAVQRYVDNQVARLQKILEAPTLKGALEKLFNGAVTNNHDGRGCLLVNCASSMMRDDAAEKDLLRSGFERMFSMVESRIRSAQDAKEISASVDPADVATLVCATLSGLRVFHKTGMQKNKLKNAADLAVKGLLLQMA
jgi:TetR/AcrR family transcriptional repressor of nem operon